MTKQKWHPNRCKALQNKPIWRGHACYDTRLPEYFSHLTEYPLRTVLVRILCFGWVWKKWLVIWNSVQPAWIKTWWGCKWIDSVNHALLKWQMKMVNCAREGMALTWFCYWSLGIRSSFLMQFLSNICFCFQSLQRDMVHLRIFKLSCSYQTVKI